MPRWTVRGAVGWSGRVALLLALAAGRAGADGRAGAPDGGPAALRQVAVAGLQAECATATVDGQPALRATFHKSGGERRLLAFQAPPPGDLSWARSVELSGRLSGVPAGSCRPAMVAFAPDGGAFYRLGAPLPVGEPAISRLSLEGLTRALFSAPGSGEWRRDRIERLWVGLTIDGPADGVLELTGLRYLEEGYRPTQPLVVSFGQSGSWSVGKDPAAEAKATVVAEGTDGTPAVRLDFTFPAGRHMYALATRSLRGLELDGYRTLQIRYRSEQPAGPTLLFTIIEPDGSQYIIDPAPPASAEWRTIDLPLDKLKLGGWTKDENQQLDLSADMSCVVGIHGSAKAAGSGTVWVDRIAFLP